MYPPEPPYVFCWVPRASNLWKNKTFEYAHPILDSNNIEPPISENHYHMQIITSLAYFMHIIIFLVCNIMHYVHIDKGFEPVLKF